MAATGYSKPPIVEAAIEFRFVERLSPRDLERLRERFRSKFPKIEDQQKIEVAVTPQGIKTNATPVGSKRRRLSSSRKC